MSYLKSTEVKVYPSAYRGVDSENNLYNPEAQLNTEFNITNILRSITSIDSYVLSWENNILKCVIHGYYFELTITDETLSNFTSNIFAIIHILPASAMDDTNTKYPAYTLVPYTQTETGAPTSLDTSLEDNDGKNFIGLTLVENASALSSGFYTLNILTKTNDNWRIPDMSKLRFGTNEIRDDLGSVPITEAFETEQIDVEDLHSTNISVDYISSKTRSNILFKNDISAAENIVCQGDITAQGAIECAQVATDKLINNGRQDILINADLTPASTYNLGNSFNRFNNIYATNLFGTFNGYANLNVISTSPSNTNDIYLMTMFIELTESEDGIAVFRTIPISAVVNYSISPYQHIPIDYLWSTRVDPDTGNIIVTRYSGHATVSAFNVRVFLYKYEDGYSYDNVTIPTLNNNLTRYLGPVSTSTSVKAIFIQLHKNN